MGAITGLFHAASIVLVVSGLAKWRDPAPFTSMWLALWGRPPKGTARVVGALEFGAGALALTGRFGAASALVVGAAYLAFAVVVVLAIRRGVASCGCFGRRAAPPSVMHVVTDLGLAVVAAVVGISALRTGEVVPSWWSSLDGGWAGVTQFVLVAMCAWLVVALDTDGAALAHEVRLAKADR